MEKERDIQLNELASDETVSEIASHLDQQQDHSTGEQPTWPAPFIASGGKDGSKPSVF